MINKKYLMPHGWQVVGVGLAATGIVGLLTSFEMLRFFGYWFAYVGLIMASISREKVEDEYIDYLRLRTISWVVLVHLLFNFVRSIVFLMPFMHADLVLLGKIQMSVQWLNLVPAWLLIYFIVFKVSIRLNLSNEQ